MKKFYKTSIIVAFLLIFALPTATFAWNCPRIKPKTIPDGMMIQPGQEISIQTTGENFSVSSEDENKMHYGQCIDGIFLNTINAGSGDEIVDGRLENDYGYIAEAFFDGACGDWTHRDDKRGDGPDCYEIHGPDNLDRVRYYCGEHLPDLPLGLPREVYEQYETNINRPPPGLQIRRVPKVDEDNDGLDDNWEIKYFKGRRVKKIVGHGEEEQEISFYMPNNNEEVLRAVLPNAVLAPTNEEWWSEMPIVDVDSDGWEWPYIDGREGSDSPSFADDIGGGWYSKPWMALYPYPENHATLEVVPLGLGQFGNLEEFTIGTDPLNLDTDSDGVMDEEDYLGREQDHSRLRVKKDYGEKYEISVRAFGVTSAYRDDDETKGRKYYQARYPLLRDDDDCELSATPERENEIPVGDGLNLKVGWGYRPAPPIPSEEEPVVVTAETSKLSELANLDLEFNWYLDAEPWEEDRLEKDKSGHNKNIFQFTPSKEACDEHIVGLEIVEEKSSRITFQELPVLMGFQSSLLSRVVGNVDLDNDKVKDLNESTGANMEDWSFDNIENEDFILPNDYFINSINDNNEDGFGLGFRKGDLVEVKLNNIEQYYDDACENKYGVYEEGKKHFYHNWWYTRRKQKMQSGKGPDFDRAYFVVQNDPRGTENDGQDTNSLSNTGSEFVSSELMDEEGNVLARNKENFRVISPMVYLYVDGAEAGTSAVDSNKPTHYTSEGSEITVSSVIDYFRPSVAYNQVWKRNDEVVSELRGTPDMISSTYTFRAGMDVNGNKLGNTEEVITLEVDSEVASTSPEHGSGEVETGDQSVVISLEEPVVGEVDSAVSGAINKLIPRHYRNVFGLFMTFGLAGFALLFVLSFMRKTSDKR